MPPLAAAWRAWFEMLTVVLSLVAVLAVPAVRWLLATLPLVLRTALAGLEP